MKLTTLISSTFASAVLAAAAPAQALPIQSFGSGSAVTQADFSAGFGNLHDGASTTYEEGGLRFSAGGDVDGAGIVCQQTLCNHDGFAGMSGGIYYNVGQYAEVKGLNDEVFRGFETTVGTGYFDADIHGIWETWLDGVLTGTGTYRALAGAVIGLYDKQGFDMVRIGTNGTWAANTAFDGTGATAIDNVRVQRAAVPEPATVTLAGLALAIAALLRRRRSSSV